MSEKEERREERKLRKRPEELAQVFKILSENIPSLIKSIRGIAFSPESATAMGKAAANYYKELKAGGIPDDVALKMTQDYVGTFSKFGDFFKNPPWAGKVSETKDDEVKDELRRAKDEYKKAVLENEAPSREREGLDRKQVIA